MSDRVRCPGWPPPDRPDAVVAAVLSWGETVLVRAGDEYERERYFEDCLRAAAGKRILVFAPDEVSASPIRARLAAEVARRERAADRDRDGVARAAAERTLTEADRELAALKASYPAKPGFLARLFGVGKPTALIAGRMAEWDAKRAAADAELRRIESRILARALDKSLPAPQESLRKRDRTDHSVDVSNATPLPPSPDENPIVSTTDAFAPTVYHPTLLRVATPADVPPTGYAADLAITLDAERVTAGEYESIVSFAPAHVVLGDPAPAISNSPYRNGVPAAFRSDFFADRWAAAKPPAWGREGNRTVCRLETNLPVERSALVREPLLDRPEIELRFAPGDEPALVEVAFPECFTAAECRSWLAAELGEARPVARGPAEWKLGESIRAVWSESDGAAGEWVESVPGVREFVVGTEPDAPTAELRFDPAAGWTRESAEVWVRDTLARSMSPTVVLPASAVPETVVEFATAI